MPGKEDFLPLADSVDTQHSGVPSDLDITHPGPGFSSVVDPFGEEYQKQVGGAYSTDMLKHGTVNVMPRVDTMGFQKKWPYGIGGEKTPLPAPQWPKVRFIGVGQGDPVHLDGMSVGSCTSTCKQT